MAGLQNLPQGKLLRFDFVFSDYLTKNWNFPNLQNKKYQVLKVEDKERGKKKKKKSGRSPTSDSPSKDFMPASTKMGAGYIICTLFRPHCLDAYNSLSEMFTSNERQSTS